MDTAAKFEVRSFTRTEIIAIEVLGGVANPQSRVVLPPLISWRQYYPTPQSWGRGGRIGVWDDIVGKSVLASSYRPPYSKRYLYAFQRYCRFCAPARHFSPPHLLSPPNFPMFPGSRWMAFGLSETRKDRGKVTIKGL